MGGDHSIRLRCTHKDGDASMRAKGIDVSHWQISLDPHSVDFIILKASEGLATDPKHDEFYPSILDIPIRGAYHYYRTAVNPIAQAEYFLDAISGHEWHFIAVDYETTGNTLDRQGAENLLSCLLHLRSTQELPVVLYTSSYCYRDNVRIWSDKFDEFPLWVAKWSEVEPGQIIEREWSIWQWTDSGDGSQVGVGSERVDRNVYNGTVDQMKLWLGITQPEEPIMKKWYQSKTLWFSILFALVNVAGVFGYAEFIPGEDVVQYVNIGISVIVALLRVFTDKGVEL